MGNGVFDISELPGCSSTKEFGAPWAADQNLRCLASNIVKKWKQQQSFGHFPDEMENDRVVCRSWTGTKTSKVGDKWELGL